MTFATIDALRESLAQPPHRTPEYAARMLHNVPEAAVVDRAKFLLERAKGKIVLDVGASGPMHEGLVQVAAKCHGIDRDGAGDVLNLDLDDVTAALPEFPGVELIVCGEILEHLGNPSWFLTRLRKAYPGVPVIVTAPNAFSEIARRHMEGGTENVNHDHCSWYSWKTLKTLAERAGYTAREFYWYGAGRPGFTEGLIFVLE